MGDTPSDCYGATMAEAKMNGRSEASIGVVDRWHRLAMAALGGLADEKTLLGIFLSLVIFFGGFPFLFPFDNQNTYLLQGLASSGYGFLSEDWLSGTRSPFFLFSEIVRGFNTIGFLEGLHILEFFLILGFAASALIIFECSLSIDGSNGSVRYLYVFIVSVLCLHSPFTIEGMADQYVLGKYLQPSEFGVLLVLSVAAFVAEKPLWPYVLAAAAGMFHQSYLLPGAFLVVTFVSYDAVLRGRIGSAAIGAGLALAIASPVLLYSVVNFFPSDGETFRLSREILAEARIPHHALPSIWFDETQLLKLLFITLGIGLSYFVNRRLTYVMTLTALLGAAASGVALLADSNALYLLFPWRISTVLMPLASIVMAIRVAGLALDHRLPALIPGFLARGVMIGLIAAVAGLSFADRLRASDPQSAQEPGSASMLQSREAEYLALVEFVRGTGTMGELYLHNPVRFESFRIRSGMPVFVDLKSHPYRDAEVVEWWRRLHWAWDLFLGGRGCEHALIEEMRDQRITHVIVDKARDGIDADGLLDCLGRYGARPVPIYRNNLYDVIRLG